MMKVLIVEDEKHNAGKLKRKLQLVGRDIEVLDVTETIEETVNWLKNHQEPDLIFLDIELSDGQSFEIFKRIRVDCPIIFTTAYDEYALKAFELNSIDYLLKPIKEEELSKALAKLENLKKSLGGKLQSHGAFFEKLLEDLKSSIAVHQPKRDRFLSKMGQRLVSVDLKDIAYFFSRNKISHIRTKDGKDYVLDYTMDDIQQMLESTRFFRLNRQVIASIESIDKTNFYFNNKLKISLIPVFEEEVLVSRERAAEYKKWMGE
ncbi:LytR/AlgR family response regulator transcription factor [Fontibacter flavus]|uniref:LytR/AlgR family response regulator transcription factor n=1 Tax=Fontibacter flavus TaxID=654838 RepID=A0ABV6FUE2_9BACT